jgi:hypothetical protein
LQHVGVVRAAHQSAFEDTDRRLALAAACHRHSEHVTEARVAWGELDCPLQAVERRAGSPCPHLPQAERMVCSRILRGAGERRADRTLGGRLVATLAR